MAGGEEQDSTCTCLTEQGTHYHMPVNTCRAIARYGQYEPFLDEPGTELLDGRETQEANLQKLELINQGSTIAGKVSDVAGSGNRAGEVAEQ
jgi:hypothetical protein